jgi:ribosomal protein S18 acetylase RimI-like enzyme
MTTCPSIHLRAATGDDLAFLAGVYASTREEELRPVPWSGEQKLAFLRMQFEAQHAEYHGRYPDASFEVIELDGTPAGRLYVHRRDHEIRIVDISLLPDHRGNGAGTSLLENLIRESESVGKPLTIHVETRNPALRLYQRLGFRPIGETGVYLLMERPLSQTLTPS